MDANHKPTHKDYYKVLEVDYDATDEKIRLNYRKLALKWHPDKHKGDTAVTAKFQEINEAYTGFAKITSPASASILLSDPDKRLEYDLNGNYEIDKYTLREYLSRFKGMILTCNGLGISHTSIWYVWPSSYDAGLV
ncbi:UNVERIFIED_CONTAM: Chaperone protein DnaJ [Sesamum calycinum]|uniref:Chaperone protein DnaJ n=1 Tax=Sesamum calycinum TaxID=2727403 RepID=A0AAW2L4X1_9LAMI